MGFRKIFSKLLMDERGISIAIDKKRKLLSRELSERMKHTIKYGPFSNMVFCNDYWWGGVR